MENETQHTPGPWKVSDWGAATVRDAVGHPVAILDFEARERVAYAMGDIGADARLLATAPELLEAAAAVLDAWDLEGGDPEQSLEIRVANALPLLRQAIAKATGQDEE